MSSNLKKENIFGTKMSTSSLANLLRINFKLPSAFSRNKMSIIILKRKKKRKLHFYFHSILTYHNSLTSFFFLSSILANDYFKSFKKCAIYMHFVLKGAQKKSWRDLSLFVNLRCWNNKYYLWLSKHENRMSDSRNITLQTTIVFLIDLAITKKRIRQVKFVFFFYIRL